MSAQRAQRGCSYNEGVQDFWGSFANLCGSLCGLCVKKWRFGFDVSFNTKNTLSAQRAQRGCSYNEGVQEFWGSFANLCGSLCGLCVKKWRFGLDVFFNTKNTMSAQRAQRAISRHKPPLGINEAQNIRTP